MNILLIGKFFPIQGGEASKAYWLMKALVNFGHHVTVITDTSSYQKNQLCSQYNDCEPYLTSFDYHDVSTSLYHTLDDLIESQLQEKTFDIIIGWYLFPYALKAIKYAQQYHIPVVIQHAGSDIHTLLSYSKTTQQEIMTCLKQADCFWVYENTISILESLGIQSFVTHVPAMPNLFSYSDAAPKLNNQFLILGAKNKSKGFHKIKSLSSQYEISIDWFGVGEQDNSHYFNTYQSLPPWEIPSLIHSYEALIYTEDNFNIATHESRIPLEALACGSLVIMNQELLPIYQEWSDFIFTFDLNDPSSLQKTLLNFHQEKDIKRKQLRETLQQKNYQDDSWYELVEYSLLTTIQHYSNK